MSTFSRSLPLALSLVLFAAPEPMAASADAFSEARRLTPEVENGKRIFRYCIDCHQPNGWGSPAEAIPQTAGQHRSVIIKQLSDIRAGNRDARRMTPYAREDLLGGAQGIADVAGYVSTLPMTPTPSHGNGRDLGGAGAVYKTRCARLCHGMYGEGDDRTVKPRIHGQHYEYLFRQLKLIRDGKRRNANKAMVRRLDGLTDAALSALADYVSRLNPPAGLVAPRGWKNPDFLPLPRRRDAGQAGNDNLLTP